MHGRSKHNEGIRVLEELICQAEPGPGAAMDDQVELRRRINATASANTPSCARDSTVPIVIVHEGAVRHHGTGTLFRVADHFFLVTAGHVFKQACELGKTFGIGGSNDDHFIVLSGQTIVTSEGQYGTSTDPLDIGLHRLAPDAVARLARKRFVTVHPVKRASVECHCCGVPGVNDKGSRAPDVSVGGAFRPR